MNRFFSVALLTLVALLTTHSAHAFTFGPFADFRSHVDPSAAATSSVTGGSGPGGYNVKDNVKVFDPVGNSSVDLRGVGYISATTPDFTGDLTITTIYGLDPNPL